MLFREKKENKKLFVDWCIENSKKLLGFDLNWQQIRLLECLDDNNYTIIKSFRCSGLTSIFLLKIVYDILYNVGTGENRILFISHDCHSAAYNLKFLMKILERCEEPIYYQMIKISNIKLRYNGNSTIIKFSGPNIEYNLNSEKPYNDLYIDNCAFIDTWHKGDGVKNEINKYKLYNKITIGSTPNRKEGIFYDIWSHSKPEYAIFEQFALKWYFDDRFNKNLKYIKNKMSYDIKNSGMLCDALQNNLEITNEWRDNMKKMMGNNTDIEIDSNFLEIN